MPGLRQGRRPADTHRPPGLLSGLRFRGPDVDADRMTTPINKDAGMWFDGDTYEPEFDQSRLTTQMGRVWLALREGEWLSLGELAARVDAPEASVSARLRDLRKHRFGNHEVARRHRGERGSGLFEYQLIPKVTKLPELQPADRQGTLL